MQAVAAPVPAPRADRDTHKWAHRTEESRVLRLALMKHIGAHVCRLPKGEAGRLIGGDPSQVKHDLAAIKDWDVDRAGAPKIERLLYICHRLGISGLDPLRSLPRAA